MADKSAHRQSNGVLDLINAGAEIAGGVAGAAAGLMAAGPPGALIGGVAGPLFTNVLKKLGSEITRRVLGPREQERVGATIAFAVTRIQEKLDQGEKVRADGFFDSGTDSRPAAEEVFEGVVLAAQREHEEKKLPYMGNLMANLAFHPEIDRAYANYLIKLADGLSYRQLCLLVLFALRDKSGLRQNDYRGVGAFSPSLIGVLQEALELEQRGLIASGEVAFGPNDIAPAKMVTQGAGVALVNLMDLIRLPRADVNALANLFADRSA